MTAAAARKKRGPGRPKAGGEDKRARILAEAFTLFGLRGYAGTSLGDVAKAADISKAGLLHHFSSKDALFAQVLEERDRVLIAEGWDSDERDIHKVLRNWVDVARRNVEAVEGTALYTMMTGAVVDSDHHAHQWFAGHLDKAVSSLNRSFEMSKEDGQLRQDTPCLSLARTLVALSDGLQVQFLCARADAAGTGEAPVYATDMVTEFQLAVDMILARWLNPDFEARQD